MALRDAGKQAEEKMNRPCRVITFFRELDDDDKAVFTSWIDTGKTPSWISTVARSDGKAINDKTVRLHLEGSCTCKGDQLFYGVRRADRAKKQTN
jgi:hypothetical protein